MLPIATKASQRKDKDAQLGAILRGAATAGWPLWALRYPLRKSPGVLADPRLIGKNGRFLGAGRRDCDAVANASSQGSAGFPLECTLSVSRGEAYDGFRAH